MSNWKNLLKFYFIFCFIFIIVNTSIIFNRDEVGIDSWLISKDFKSKFTKIDDIIFNKNRDIIVLGILKEFINVTKTQKKIYISQENNINWGYKTSISYYCNQTKVCKIEKKKIDFDLIKTNNNLLKKISFKKFVSGKFIENITIYDCKASTNLVIRNYRKDLILTCSNELN